MAIEKRLLVKSPVTADGINPVYNENKQPVFKEAILKVHAKPHIDSLNARKSQVLKDEVSIVDYDTDFQSVVKQKK